MRAVGLYYSERDGSECAHGDSGGISGYDLLSPNLVELGVQPKVINLLQVRTRQQVQLEVKFAEVDRKSMREIGELRSDFYRR